VVKKYEVVFILKQLEEETIEANIVKFETLLTNSGAVIEEINRWGKRRLAYEIKKHREGFYTIVTFSAEPKAVFELERVMKITDDVLKYMVINLDE